MKIVLIHYHLKTGGVSTVIKQQVEAIQNECQVLVLTGEPPHQDFPGDTITIKGLGYDHLEKPSSNPHSVAAAIMDAIHAKIGGPCDVIHVHNPTLAKNRQLLSILRLLKNKPFNLLLQIHDFAEDGRPLVYYPDEYISSCHYAVINSRDYYHLLSAGLSPMGLHLLPNSITPFPSTGQARRRSNQVLYPVRGIRRKNIGEAIFLSLFFKKGEQLAITLPPNSPADFGSYNGWKQFVEEKKLAVAFEVGLRDDFFALLHSARFIITTSITEGFGFSFLEPWLANNTLWGRKLPDICRDFENNGIRLDYLYDELVVPLEWIGKTTFYQRWRACVVDMAGLYKYPINPSAIDQAFESMTSQNYVDFGILDEFLQKRVISRVISQPSAADQLCRLNPFLNSPGEVSDREKMCRQNRQAVLTHYNQTVLKRRLLETYRRVTSTRVRHRIDKHALLSLFFNLEKFSLLKWCRYVESVDA